jgi:hypothetical protein
MVTGCGRQRLALRTRCAGACKRATGSGPAAWQTERAPLATSSSASERSVARRSSARKLGRCQRARRASSVLPLARSCSSMVPDVQSAAQVPSPYAWTKTTTLAQTPKTRQARCRKTTAATRGARFLAGDNTAVACSSVHAVQAKADVCASRRTLFPGAKHDLALCARGRGRGTLRFSPSSGAQRMAQRVACRRDASLGSPVAAMGTHVEHLSSHLAVPIFARSFVWGVMLVSA